MTKEEVLKMIEAGEFTIKEMYEFYEVKNQAGLETYLESRFDEVNVNNEYVVNSFKFMFETRESEVFNPLEEKYRYYAMVLPGIYSIPSEHVQIMVAGMGLFKAMLMLEKLLQEREEVKYFDSLYKEYIKEMYSIGRTANKYVKLLDKTLSEFLSNNGKETIEKLVKDFISAKDDLLNKVE
jgi:hypothetical protein